MYFVAPIHLSTNEKDILSQIYDVIQSEIALQKQVH